MYIHATVQSYFKLNFLLSLLNTYLIHCAFSEALCPRGWHMSGFLKLLLCGHVCLYACVCVSIPMQGY